MILKQNEGILDLWDRSKGFWEVPRGFIVPKWVYYGGTYVFMRIGGGLAENFGGNWEGMGDFLYEIREWSIVNVSFFIKSDIF